ncbi:MAG: hypothetical protein Q8T08_09770, partial [Ignavibacteria bacterium]|nr:hypothetical protein [Ignavibacteria bacterium]
MRPKSPSQFQLKRDETALAIENSAINVLYEAVFQYDDVLIMLDVLVRDGNMWKAYEVKSSKAISDTYLKDAALQYYVLKGCNVLLSDFSLIYMNKDYILEDSLVLEDLFITQSVLNHVDKQIDIIEKQIHFAKNTLELTSSPEIAIGNQCNYPYPCDFKGHCWKNVPEKSVLNLTTFDTDSLFELYHGGIQLVEQFPIDLIQITNQQYEIEAYNTNTLVFDKEALESYLEYFDITEITFLKVLFKQAAVPVIPKIKPYQLIPIAISFLKNNETEATTIVFSEDESGIKNFINLINDLILNSTIITEDADLLLNCIEGLSANFTAQNRILGLSELVENGMIYHPILSKD